MKRIIIFLFLICISSIGYTHSGRTDKYGGHNNRKTGGYHYHNRGSVHDANNPYQNHTTCGVCNKSKTKQKTIIEHKQSEIYFVQSSLMELGYSVTIDGIWGDSSEKQLKKFQSDNSISSTGKINKQTKLKIIELLNNKWSI